MNPVFFTDRDLGKRFPDILRAAGLTVERHIDHFQPDCPDEVWLETIGQRGWTAITHDQRIRYKPNEREAVIRHNVPLIVVIGDAPHPELAQSFVKTAARILQFVAQHTPPYIAKVYRPTPAELARNPEASGSIKLWYPT